MHNARQRALLSVLGINVWIPRAAKTTPISSAAISLWRQGEGAFDQSGHEVASYDVQLDAVGNPSVSQQHVIAQQSTAVRENTAGQSEVTVATDELAVKETSIKEVIKDVTKVISPEALALEADILNLAPFRLQACQINHWVILINEADLQDEQARKLWQNILAVFGKPAISYFSWPLAGGQRWQRATGARAALTGFLFRMGLDRRAGLMSELDSSICPDRIERLPYLAELLAEPLKKRILWQFLKQQQESSRDSLQQEV
ncbi:hypothetical protein ACF3NA_06455 [Alkanindiges sp. WGS2144]|uniref:hypothetical protein n=1 Tax=Alkanindiges sp. WGS2144 TaxID=3366808 RepID=UPI00375393B2